MSFDHLEEAYETLAAKDVPCTLSIEVKIPEDQEALELFLQGSQRAAAIENYDNTLRSFIKHESFGVDQFISNSRVFEEVLQVVQNSDDPELKEAKLRYLYLDAMVSAYEDARDQLYNIADVYKFDVI